MAQNRQLFGRTVRDARRKKDVGLRELARRVGINYSTLSRIERGQRPPPDLDMVVAIAEELDAGKSKLLALAGVSKEIVDYWRNEEVENWIEGEVVDTAGKLTVVKAGEWTLHVVDCPDSERVQLGLRPEDVTLFLTDDGFSESSARNRLRGEIVDIVECGNYNLATLDCGAFSMKVAITDASLERMDLGEGKEVYATFKATAPVVRSG
ncbi:MAG: helix-turn-helix domain-containing protein [Candidatus Bipolaricaulota bacterium]